MLDQDYKLNVEKDCTFDCNSCSNRKKIISILPTCKVTHQKGLVVCSKKRVCVRCFMPLRTSQIDDKMLFK